MFFYLCVRFRYTIEKMEILGIDFHAWITIFLIVGMFATMLMTKLPADVVFLSVMALLLVTGCLPVEEALSGFSSSTVIVIGALFVVVAGLEATGVLQWVVRHLLGEPSSYLKAILRLMLPVALLSSVLSNTTVVALFIKVVKMWAKKIGVAPSKLLIPLSYAAGMGGVCTLIGTPPNLIISSFYADTVGKPLGIFSTTLPGLFCLAVGVATIIVLQKLLPSRKSPEEQLGIHDTATTELKVTADNHLIGQSFEECHLLEQSKDCQLLGVVHFDGEVERLSEKDTGKTHYVMGGDTLVFVGNEESVQKIGRHYDFHYDTTYSESEPRQGFRSIVSTALMFSLVILSAFDVLPLLNCCFIAALLMLLTRCCTVQQAKNAISWDVLMVFACSVTLGKAIDNTGLAQLLADNMVNFCGTNALLALIIIATLGTFLTEFISNTACGAIMAPVAISIATQMGVSPLPFCMALAISVSSSFATPIGSPTHLMVYVPGGYRFIDFVKIGLPMNFVILAANIFITLLLFPF